MRKSIVPAGLLVIAIALGMVLPCLTPVATAAKEPPEETAIVRHLNAAITWYRDLASASEFAGQPSDAFYLDNARNLAKQALQLSFESAEAEASLLAATKGGDPGTRPDPRSQASSSNQQAVAKSAADTANLISRIQAQIEALNGQIDNTSGKRLQELTSQRESLQQQLDFNKALQEALQKLSMFMSNGAAASGGLPEEIENLKKSVPEVFAKTPSKPAATGSSSSPSNSQEGVGLISQLGILFTRIGDMREVNRLIHDGARVSNLARELQLPLRSQLRNTIQQGRDLANQTPPQDPAGREANRQKMISLTAQFRKISTATLPLTQEIILLDDSQASLRQWESSVHWGYIHILEAVLVRLGILLAGVGLVLGFSEIWLKMTFKYVRDGRRRHQFLLLRRIVTILLMTIVFALGFVSEFSSLATFAGFLTAGIAVALQTLILSIAAYFFLIGRHGVRVGDRITVSGVTGDVIDVGLVRLSLMELGGAGSDLHPTGRVVVVSNSVLLQGAPFYKQIPGTAYAWHEVVVRLERGGDCSFAEAKLLEAVNSVYSQYRESIEQQHEMLEGMMAVATSVPSPQGRLQLLENNLDLIVRYPVVLHRESEIDNQMAKKVVEVIDSLPQLKAEVGAPTIRPAVKA